MDCCERDEWPMDRPESVGEMIDRVEEAGGSAVVNVGGRAYAVKILYSGPVDEKPLVERTSQGDET